MTPWGGVPASSQVTSQSGQKNHQRSRSTCNRGQGDWRLTREGGGRIVIVQKIELKLKFRLAINPSIGRLSRFRMI
jgi:hypothetical protein